MVVSLKKRSPLFSSSIRRVEVKVFFFTTSIYNFFLFQRRRTNASNVLLNGLSYLLIHKVGCYFYFFFQVLSKKFLFAWKFLLSKRLIFRQNALYFRIKVNFVRSVPIWYIRIGRYHNKTYIQFPSSTADDHCTKSNIKLISFIFFRWIHLFFSHLFFFVGIWSNHSSFELQFSCYILYYKT